jgi:Transcriptional regulatory protein, C terminal
MTRTNVKIETHPLSGPGVPEPLAAELAGAVLARVLLGTAALGTSALGPTASAGPEPIGTETACSWRERVPPPGRDATLLAVVPIPGTGTSLAIVGYAISTSAPERGPAARPDPDAGTGAGLLVDRARRRAWADRRELSLTFLEFELLAFLSAHPDAVFSRADLVEQVWRRGRAGDREGATAPDTGTVTAGSRTVDVHVSRLRHKLGPVYGPCLITEHRAGYRFRSLPS